MHESEGTNRGARAAAGATRRARRGRRGTALLGGAGCTSDERCTRRRRRELGRHSRSLRPGAEPPTLRVVPARLAPDAPVREAIERHRRGLDANPVEYLARQRGRGSRQRAPRRRPRTCGAPPDDIALTDSTTMGLGLLYSGLRLRPGDEVVTTDARLLRDPRGAAAARPAGPAPRPEGPRCTTTRRRRRADEIVGRDRARRSTPRRAWSR